MAAGCLVFAFVGTGTPYWMFAIGLVLFGCGMGLASPPATETIIETLPRARQGVVSAVTDVSRELGGALGTAILGSALTVGYRTAIDNHTGTLAAPVFDAVRGSPAVGYQVARSAADGRPIVAAIRAGLIDGFLLSMWIGAATLIVAAVYIAARTPGRQPASDDLPETA